MRWFILPILLTLIHPCYAEIGTISVGVVMVATVSENGQCSVNGEPVDCGLPVNDNAEPQPQEPSVQIAQWRQIKE